MGKGVGGLALGGIIDRNKALLGKWLWRYLEPHSLWLAVIRSKYGQHGNHWAAVNVAHSSHYSPRKGISQLLPSFLPFTKLSLGNGNMIRFSVDQWVSSTPLSSRFTRLFNLSYKKDGVVSTFFSPPSDWSLFLWRNLKEPEIQEYVELSAILQQFQPSVSQSDTRMWTISSSGIFPVSSFFSALSSNQVASPFPYNQFGSLCLLSKYKVFYGKLHGVVDQPLT